MIQILSGKVFRACSKSFVKQVAEIVEAQNHALIEIWIVFKMQCFWRQIRTVSHNVYDCQSWEYFFERRFEMLFEKFS